MIWYANGIDDTLCGTFAQKVNFYNHIYLFTFRAMSKGRRTEKEPHFDASAHGLSNQYDGF